MDGPNCRTDLWVHADHADESIYGFRGIKAKLPLRFSGKIFCYGKNDISLEGSTKLPVLSGRD